jgi:hypothetical protein
MTSRADHLTETEFVDLLDGTLDARRRQHADGCEQCAAQAADLVASLQEAQAIDVPEPPPFFWSQFSARVGDAVATEAAGRGAGRFAWARPAWFAAAAGVAVLVLALFAPRNPGAGKSTGTASIDTTASSHAERVPDDEADLDSDEAWALVRSLAEDLDEDQMDDEGISPGAGAAERLTLQLTDAERAELARLLEEQLRRSGARESAS